MSVNTETRNLNPLLSEMRYDYIFAGFGASASLLLLEMNRRNLLKGAKVLIIDPDNKEKNDKTFCFWATEDEQIVSSLKPMITHFWSEARAGAQDKQVLNPYRYHHIPGINLYRHAREVLEENQCFRLNLPVNQIGEDESGLVVFAGDYSFRSGRVFDSRPPVFREPGSREIHIHQSFIGWVIQTEKPLLDPRTMHFMDFQVEQNGGTQFVYLLPFSSNSALVELTRFGSDLILEDEGRNQLNSYIQERFGAFRIKSVEKGCIPMSNARICTQNFPGLSLLGARNHAVKPSTGYAFKNMYSQASEIAASLASRDFQKLDALNSPQKTSSRSRFAFYDALLLRILKEHPENGKAIFLKLFRHNRLNQILRFLDENSGLGAEIIMFSKLPIIPFVRALFHYQGVQIVRPIILMLLVLMLTGLGFNPELQTISGYTLLTAGMILVGIPHGAVDHLLESNRWNQHKSGSFIFTYLFQAAVMALLWLLAPVLALLIFVAYSSFHFGEADGKHWGFSVKTATLWGTSVLIYILGTHGAETNSILNLLSNFRLPFEIPVAGLFPWFVYAIFRKNIPFMLTIVWLTISSFLPLIFAFGIYFIGQHSCSSWVHICSHLSLSSKKVWLKAMPFHLAAWVLMALFFLFWPQESVTEANQLAVFFVFIACISLPHAISMHSVYAKKTSD